MEPVPKDISRGKLEDEIRATIAAFEQILEAMPDDRDSLEAMRHAHVEMGDAGKARHYLLRLVRVLLDEGDVAAASARTDELIALGPDDERAAALLGQVRRLQAGAAAADASAEPPEGGSEEAFELTPAMLQINMAEELAFAWALMEAGEISQDEYAGIVQDLTEMTAGESVATVSVLHVIEGRGFKGLERIVAKAALLFRSPYVSLDSFDLQHETVTLLPLDFMVRRGAMVFSTVGPHALVVVMNPCDRELRRIVERLAGRPLHVFITLASEFDRALERVTEVSVDRA